MSNSNNIYTHKIGNLDTRVWLTLILLTVVSAGLLAFKMITNVHCTPFQIATKGYTAGKQNSFYVGQAINFTTNFTGKEEIVWDFGDNGRAKGAATTHVYKHEGTFIVSATVNGKCVETYKLTIVQLEQQQNANTVSMNNPISGPELVYAGDPASFNCALAANSYEWTVLNSPEFPIQSSTSATYSFPIAGTKIIELKLDGDASKVYRKNIQVLPQLKTAEALPPPTNGDMPMVLPPPTNSKDDEKEDDVPAAPAKPKVMIIPNEEFKALLEGATEGKTDLQSLNQYLCIGASTKVLLNGTDWENVGSFMQKIYNKKKYDIKSVEAVRDENNCVTILKIKYKKRLL